MNRYAFHLLTPAESAEAERSITHHCPCSGPAHRGLFDGRTTCGVGMSKPGVCPDCKRCDRKPR